MNFSKTAKATVSSIKDPLFLASDGFVTKPLSGGVPLRTGGHSEAMREMRRVARTLSELQRWQVDGLSGRAQTDRS